MRFVNPGATNLATVMSDRLRLRPYENLFFAVMVVIGFVIVACLFATVASALSNQNGVGRKRSQMLQMRKEEMKLAKIPKELQAKVEATYDYVWRYGGAKDGIIRDP